MKKFLALAIPLLSAGCKEASPQNTPEIAYPYQAMPKREAAIRAGYPKIATGMTTQDIHRLMGKPDQVRVLYEPKIKNSKQIGWTHWYLIRREREQDVTEKIVRVSVDLDGRVTKVDHWGF